MLAYAVRTLIFKAITLVIISVVSFLIVHLAPGEEKVCWGHLFIAPVMLTEFADEMNALREEWHARERSVTD